MIGVVVKNYVYDDYHAKKDTAEEVIFFIEQPFIKTGNFGHKGSDKIFKYKVRLTKNVYLLSNTKPKLFVMK